MSALSTYSYRARDAEGQIVTGMISAASAQEVGSRLRAEGKYVLAVEDRALRSASATIDPDQLRRQEASKRVRREDVIAFCQQLSVMLETGVPLAEALESFCKQTRRREFRAVLESLRDDIYAGEPFSRAMVRWRRVFPALMVSLMKASEASGTMAMMLGRIGDYLAKERRTLKQIRGALAYPMFMMMTGLAMTVFLMAFILPRFARIYEQRAASLPRPTKFLIGVSEFITTQYPIYLPIVFCVGIAFLIWRKTTSGRTVLDWLKLHVPILRVMYGQLYLTRASRTMATLLAAGVNLLDIIDITRGVTRNIYYDRLWDSMEKGVRDGRQISDAAFASPVIPPNVASMIASGEKSGRLASVMGKISEFAEQELDAAAKQVTSMIEPLMIVFMGVVIGGIAMALLLPIFSMGKVMSGG